ncbi:glycosyl transferase family 90 [Terriglobus tenax]|uniref:glycosyl transferase family 90 n=1 Tax=Terriglobus tenax TaxID=1111115 RepID=UPI0021DF9758|nr:glycosyl transferase family 90 [Terriglobus tenax]
MKADVSRILHTIPELAWVQVDAHGVEYIPPRYNLCKARSRFVLKFLTQQGALKRLQGEFFVCLYDGWREYSTPFANPTFVPWSDVDPARFTGLGSMGEPRFMHLDSNGIFPVLPLPVLAFCRHRGDTNTLLIPDPHFLNTRFQNYRQQIDLHDLPWEAKAEILFWRGRKHITNYPQQIDPHPREYITSGHWPFVDACYSKDIPISEQLGCKYILDADGFVNAWSGCFWKLYANSVPVKFRSHWEQWYYPSLRDRENVIFTDLDLETTYDWLRNNDAEASRIAMAGRQVAARLTYEYACEEYLVA